MKLSEFFKVHEWCKNFYARDKDNKKCQPDDSNACSWCVLGAAYKIDDSYLNMEESPTIKVLSGFFGGYASVARFNDTFEGSKDDLIKYLEERGL